MSGQTRYSHVWNLSDASKETKSSLSLTPRPRWSPRAEHKARTINVSKEKLEAWHCKPLGAASKPHGSNKAWHEVGRMGSQEEHDQATPGRVLLWCPCPEPGSLSQAGVGNEWCIWGTGKRLRVWWGGCPAVSRCPVMSRHPITVERSDFISCFFLQATFFGSKPCTHSHSKLGPKQWRINMICFHSEDRPAPQEKVN